MGRLPERPRLVKARKAAKRERVTWAALPAERQRYWAPFLATLPKSIRPAFRRDSVLFEMKLDREARGWVRTLAREFTPPGQDWRDVERKALARVRKGDSLSRRKSQEGETGDAYPVRLRHRRGRRGVG